MTQNKNKVHRVLALAVLAMSVASLAAIESEHRPLRAPQVLARDAVSPEVVALRDGAQLDLNAATTSELRLLPRVGPVLAERIAEHRPYRDVADLARVPGIGQKTLARLRSWVKVDSATQQKHE